MKNIEKLKRAILFEKEKSLVSWLIQFAEWVDPGCFVDYEMIEEYLDEEYKED